MVARMRTLSHHLDEPGCDGLASVLGCHMQGRCTAVVGSEDIGADVEQHQDDLLVSCRYRQMQRRASSYAWRVAPLRLVVRIDPLVDEKLHRFDRACRDRAVQRQHAEFVRFCEKLLAAFQKQTFRCVQVLRAKRFVERIGCLWRLRLARMYAPQQEAQKSMKAKRTQQAREGSAVCGVVFRHGDSSFRCVIFFLFLLPFGFLSLVSNQRKTERTSSSPRSSAMSCAVSFFLLRKLLFAPACKSSLTSSFLPVFVA